MSYISFATLKKEEKELFYKSVKHSLPPSYIKILNVIDFNFDLHKGLYEIEIDKVIFEKILKLGIGISLIVAENKIFVFNKKYLYEIIIKGRNHGKYNYTVEYKDGFVKKSCVKIGNKIGEIGNDEIKNIGFYFDNKNCVDYIFNTKNVSSNFVYDLLNNLPTGTEIGGKKINQNILENNKKKFNEFRNYPTKNAIDLINFGFKNEMPNYFQLKIYMEYMLTDNEIYFQNIKPKCKIYDSYEYYDFIDYFPKFIKPYLICEKNFDSLTEVKNLRSAYLGDKYYTDNIELINMRNDILSNMVYYYQNTYHDYNDDFHRCPVNSIIDPTNFPVEDLENLKGKCYFLKNYMVYYGCDIFMFNVILGGNDTFQKIINIEFDMTNNQNKYHLFDKKSLFHILCIKKEKKEFFEKIINQMSFYDVGEKKEFWNQEDIFGKKPEYYLGLNLQQAKEEIKKLMPTDEIYEKLEDKIIWWENNFEDPKYIEEIKKLFE